MNVDLRIRPADSRSSRFGLTELMAPHDPPTDLRAFLAELRRARIHFRLRDSREGAVGVDVAVPGERWEVDFLDDGAVEVEVFRGDGEVAGAAALGDLFARHSD